MTRDEALLKIKKCLALGRSANEHEAAAAMRQAHKLMEQFGLNQQDVTLTDVPESTVRAVGLAANAWEVRLVQIIANAFGCMIYSEIGGTYYSRQRFWKFVGFDAAPTVAGYTGDVLLRQLAKARLAYIGQQSKNCKKATKTMRGDAFAMAWVVHVREKVSEFASQPSEERMELLSTYMKKHHGSMTSEHTRDSTKGQNIAAAHYAAGATAGRNAQLHRGVGGMQEQRLLG